MKALATERRLIRVPTASLSARLHVDTVLYVVVLSLAAAFVVGFAIAALFRLSYPFALQLTEPDTLAEVERVLHGQPLYVQPTFDYVPMIYGPVYFYLAAAAAQLFGGTYAPLRLVSLVASLGTALIIGYLVKRETGSLGAGLVAAGLYAASFPFSEPGRTSVGSTPSSPSSCLLRSMRHDGPTLSQARYRGRSS